MSSYIWPPNSLGSEFIFSRQVGNDADLGWTLPGNADYQEVFFENASGLSRLDLIVKDIADSFYTIARWDFGSNPDAYSLLVGDPTNATLELKTLKPGTAGTGPDLADSVTLLAGGTASQLALWGSSVDLVVYSGVGGAEALRFPAASPGQIRSSADFLINVAGKGLRIKEGSNAKMGVSTLVAGTVTVANTSVTASSRIFVTSQVDGGTPGFLRVSARTAGVSFTITSSDVADTSTVAWIIVEPA